MIKVIVNRVAPVPLTDAVIKHVVLAAAELERKIKGTVEITFVTSSEIKKINRAERGINAATDVLSFAWQEDRGLPTEYLGELYLSYPYIAAQAKRFGVSAKEEALRMLTHGLLHLAGHDHQTKTGANKMFKIQEAVVAKILKH